MSLRVDSDELPAAERFDVVRDALREASGASEVELDPDGLEAHISWSPLGATAIFTAAATTMRLVRDTRASRDAPDEVLAIGVHHRGVGRIDVYGQQRVVGPGELILADVTRPFEWSWQGKAASGALQLPRSLTGLSVDAVRVAALNLRPTPLAKLFGRHLSGVVDDVGALASSPAAATLGEVSVQLARAVLVEAAGAAAGRQAVAETLEATLLLQVQAYVDQHLRDPELSADSIAAALSVSRRHLYRMCSAAGVSIEQQIITARLARARTELRARSASGRTIAAVAHSVGFKDVDHFRRRFKQAYGVSPQEWRAQPASAGEPLARAR